LWSCFEISTRFSAFENLCAEIYINSASEKIRDNTISSTKESAGYYEVKRHAPCFDEGYSELLDQREEAKLQWLHNKCLIDGDKLNNIRHDGSRYSSDNKKEYLKHKITKLRASSKMKKNIKYLQTDHLLADTHNILNGWKIYFSQLLNVHNISDIRQIEVHAAEPLMPDHSSFENEIANTK
jgi:hypothetical protein